jgi:DNA invertase Pin-like site-specific DNA recombinase
MQAGAGIRSLAEPFLDTTSDFAEIVFAILGVAAKLERRRIRDAGVAVNHARILHRNFASGKPKDISALWIMRSEHDFEATRRRRNEQFYTYASGEVMDGLMGKRNRVYPFDAGIG